MSFFNLDKRDEVAFVWLDAPDARVNTLSFAVMNDFSGLLDTLEQDADITAAILISRKKDSFIVGADINEFAEFSDKEEVKRLIGEGHALFNRIESFPKPIVAAVHGACVGGGLELAMALPLPARHQPQTYSIRLARS